MTEDDRDEGLRVGGWGPYRDASGPGSAPSPRPVPPLTTPSPGAAGDLQRRLLTLLGANPPRHSLVSTLSGGSPRRVLLAGVTAVVIVAAGLVALTVGGGDEPTPPPAALLVVPSFSPAAPVSIRPEPTLSPPPPPTFVPPPTTPVRTTTKPVERATTTPPPPKPSSPPPPPAPALVPGARVALEAADRSGRRLRHRDFLARLEVLRSEADRDSSRFTVRNGLNGQGCVSLESVNYPGYFLRHRDFILRLDRQDGSPLFQQDATFCPKPTGPAFIFAATNYPTHVLVADGRGVRLAQVSPGQATAFVVRNP
ncbi:AbfB domain-containing protein [Actinoplanes sp. NPDC048796]|uniref:AbfB domain-containing protein n=1 Tax=unclassified Actinoplanes TaxID=2626549 RepID=UPI0033FAC916